MADIDDFMDDEPKPKKESLTGFFLALVIGTVVALGTGWFVGGQFAVTDDEAAIETAEPKINTGEEEETEAAETDEQAGDETEVKAEGTLVPLDPILVILDSSDNAFMRLELALVLREGAEAISSVGRAKLQSDLLSFSKTLSLAQIAGPSGFLHLRDDLIDRARLITNGDVEDVLIMSMVAE